MHIRNHNRKLIPFISFLIIFAFSIGSLKAEPFIGEGTQTSPYLIKIGYGIGQAEYQYGNSGRSESYRASFEYNPKNWGIEFGINRANYFVPPDKASEFLVAYILSVNAPERFGLNLFTAAQVDQITFSKTFLDIGPTFHLRPGSKIDPYIGAGFGIGDNSGGKSALRGYAKLGVRFNFERTFLFFELEGGSVNRYYQGEQYVYSDGSGIFGAGYYFGKSDAADKKPEPKIKEPESSPPIEKTEEKPKPTVEEKQDNAPTTSQPEEGKKDPVPTTEEKPSVQ